MFRVSNNASCETKSERLGNFSVTCTFSPPFENHCARFPSQSNNSKQTATRVTTIVIRSKNKSPLSVRVDKRFTAVGILHELSIDQFASCRDTHVEFRCCCKSSLTPVVMCLPHCPICLWAAKMMPCRRKLACSFLTFHWSDCEAPGSVAHNAGQVAAGFDRASNSHEVAVSLPKPLAPLRPKGPPRKSSVPQHFAFVIAFITGIRCS